MSQDLAKSSTALAVHFITCEESFVKKVPYRPAWLLVGAVVLALGVAVAGGAAVWNSVYRTSPLTLGWLTTLNPFGSSDQSIEIAVALPLTGAFGPVGQGTLEGIQMAVDEANVGGLPPSSSPSTTIRAATTRPRRSPARSLPVAQRWY